MPSEEAYRLLVVHISLDEPGAVASLLYKLREAGIRAQATALIERLPAAGQFGLLCQQEGRAQQFSFGRETDSRPAKPWGWTDPG
jgi:hypothetical protein